MLFLHKLNRLTPNSIGSVFFGLVIACLSLTMIDSKVRAEKLDQNSINLSNTTSPLLSLPPNQGKPIKVSMGIYITNVAAINETEQLYNLSGYIIAKWQDKRLGFDPKKEKNNKKYYEVTKVWLPDLEMINAVANFNKGNAELIADPEGNIRYTIRFYATLSADINLKKFPFDSQDLKILIESFTYDINNINFIENDFIKGWDKDPYVSLPEWTIKGISSQVGISKFEPSTEYYSRYIFMLKVQRDYIFYLYKIFIPLLMIVIVSWMVFLLDIDDISNQITISFTTLLIATVFSFTTTNLLPKIPYLAYINVFFLVCYLFIFLLICEIILVNKLRKNDNSNIGLKVRQASRWLFPAGFGMTNLLLFTVFILL